MSETVHYKGKLIPTGKTLAEFDPKASDIYDHYYDAVEIDGMIYTVEKTDIDPDYDIERIADELAEVYQKVGRLSE